MIRHPWILALGTLAAAAAAADGSAPGSYCPLPEAGEVPQCLVPAQDAYGEFFSAIDDDAADAASLERVETDVARGAGEENAYLALSSLAYGYYRLAQRAAETPGEDPRVVARLERWNGLLSRAYAGSADDVRYRSAVQRAAQDLNQRVDFPLTCSDARGEPTECNSTESVLRGFNTTSEKVGIRGALERLIGRFWGTE